MEAPATENDISIPGVAGRTIAFDPVLRWSWLARVSSRPPFWYALAVYSGAWVVVNMMWPPPPITVPMALGFYFWLLAAFVHADRTLFKWVLRSFEFW